MTKLLSLSVAIVLFATSCKEETSQASAPAPAPTTPAVAAALAGAKTHEVACATCIYKMTGVEGCVLATKIDDKTYLVTGVEMPGHESGLCDGAHQAELVGELQGDRFVATAFALKP